MNTCGTCRFLGKEIKAYDPDKEEHVNSGYHPCKLIEMPEADPPLKNQPAAYVMDGSWYHAVLCVREEFGCTQWQPK